MDVDWDELLDGRVRRLRVGRHYEAEIGEVEAAANAAAAHRGMVARTAYEKVPRMQYFESYVWVQFADHEIAPGEPCPCGEPNPVTIHPSFARCPSCGSRLAIKRPKGSKRGRSQIGDVSATQDGDWPSQASEEVAAARSDDVRAKSGYKKRFRSEAADSPRRKPRTKGKVFRTRTKSSAGGRKGGRKKKGPGKRGS